MSAFLQALHRRAAQVCPRIVFAEGSDARVLNAVGQVVTAGIARALVIVPDETWSEAVIAKGGTPIITATDERGAVVDEALTARARARKTSETDALKHREHPLAFANALVAQGAADACVAGAVYTTSEVLRWSLRLLGTAGASRSVSGAFYMVAPDGGMTWPHEVITFSDCGVIPEPTAEQLADIAIAAADDRVRIVGDEPSIAFLSFSTRGSAEASSVARVRAAVALTRARRPDLRIDGELQADAALSAAVAARKAPASVVAGTANILVFPSLDAGNIAYKLVQYLGGATAIGPIVQGLRKPSLDLSRGASADDIVHAAAIAALQAAP
ncbi:MAG TPA: phosphate acyltransferase [Gemmatimonadaceae bacterium]|nr:phosphate acyltransferase [Gemmatimonadaceae bacterium]